MVPKSHQGATAEHTGQDVCHANRECRGAAGARQQRLLADVLGDLADHVGGDGEAPAGDHLRRLHGGGANHPARAVYGEIDSGLEHSRADHRHDGDEGFR